MGKGREMIHYATAKDIGGTWTYQGALTGMAENSFTIHPGITEFNGNWYLFYHNATLTKDGVGGATGRRSVCVDYLYYHPDGRMAFVEQTKAGGDRAAEETGRGAQGGQSLCRRATARGETLSRQFRQGVTSRIPNLSGTDNEETFFPYWPSGCGRLRCKHKTP